MALTLDLKDRVALVTGGSRGIGMAVVRRLAEAGAAVVIGADRSLERAEESAGAVRAAGGRATVAAGDIVAPGAPDAYVAAALDVYGRLDILVNNAGIWVDTPIETYDDAVVSRILSVNLEAVFHLCRAATPLLKQSPAGRIVNISSTASLMGEPFHSAYAASKGGLDALTRSLAVELGPDRVTVNSVAPGWTQTEMTEEALRTDEGRALVASIPLGKVATADDIAFAVAYLASDWAGHITGATLPVEGAYRIRR